MQHLLRLKDASGHIVYYYLSVLNSNRDENTNQSSSKNILTFLKTNIQKVLYSKGKMLESYTESIPTIPIGDNKRTTSFHISKKNSRPPIKHKNSSLVTVDDSSKT